MTRRIAAAAILAAAPLLAACGSGLNHGTITGKQVNPAYYYTYWQSVYCGKGCWVHYPVQEYMPTEYVLDLKDGKQTGTADVDEASWDAAYIGEYWPPATQTGATS